METIHPPGWLPWPSISTQPDYFDRIRKCWLTSPDKTKLLGRPALKRVCSRTKNISLAAAQVQPSQPVSRRHGGIPFGTTEEGVASPQTFPSFFFPSALIPASARRSPGTGNTVGDSRRRGGLRRPGRRQRARHCKSQWESCSPTASTLWQPGPVSDSKERPVLPLP